MVSEETMRLDLSKMRGGHGAFAWTLDPSAFARQDDYRVASEVRVELDVHKSGEKVRLVGRLQGTLELTCGRCLDPLPWPVDATFDLVYLPQAANRGEGEIEVGADELSTAFYRDEEIDLAGLIREQFYLALPMKPLCAEACRGLCPECGINLNRESCTCVHRWEDPRLAALKGLLGR